MSSTAQREIDTVESQKLQKVSLHMILLRLFPFRPSRIKANVNPWIYLINITLKRK